MFSGDGTLFFVDYYTSAQLVTINPNKYYNDNPIGRYVNGFFLWTFIQKKLLAEGSALTRWTAVTLSSRKEAPAVLSNGAWLLRVPKIVAPQSRPNSPKGAKGNRPKGPIRPKGNRPPLVRTLRAGASGRKGGWLADRLTHPSLATPYLAHQPLTKPFHLYQLNGKEVNQPPPRSKPKSSR